MESSEDKTKRKFAKYLLDPIWTYQYSVFCDDPEESVNLLEYQKVFRRELGRKFPNQPFLIRIQTLRLGKVHQAYLTLYTTQKTVGFQELAYRYFPTEVNVIYQQLTERKREVKANKILTQNPHDLTRVFGEVRIRRYGVINKHLLAGIETEVE